VQNKPLPLPDDAQPVLQVHVLAPADEEDPVVQAAHDDAPSLAE